MHIIDMWVGVGRTSIECDAGDGSHGLRINDLLLALDYVSGPLIRGDIVSCALVSGIFH